MGWIRGVSKLVGKANGLLAECWSLREDLSMAKASSVQFFRIEFDAKILRFSWGANACENLALPPSNLGLLGIVPRISGM